MTRPSLDQYLMELAKAAATRTTCIKRGVGCVLADSRGRVLSVGYNGVSSGMPHCNEFHDTCGPINDPQPYYEHACKGYELPPGRDSCLAVHAEQNALLQCHDPDRIAAAYVTLSPCKPCIKLLMNTGCTRIVFQKEHTDPWPREQWLKMGRAWDVLG